MPDTNAEVAAEVFADMTDQTLADDRIVNTPSDNKNEGDASHERIKELEAKVAEHEAAFLRARADFANFKRRTEEERDGLRQFVSADLMTRLLPVLDNFERALNAAAQTSDYDKLIGGINAVYRQLQEFLQREGVTEIDAINQPFDPNYHNAVLREETTEYPENTVVEELQKGYTLGNKVLRPTMVKVATGSE
jgi:molecular chaperone GrpE